MAPRRSSRTESRVAAQPPAKKQATGAAEANVASQDQFMGYMITQADKRDKQVADTKAELDICKADLKVASDRIDADAQAILELQDNNQEMQASIARMAEKAKAMAENAKTMADTNATLNAKNAQLEATLSAEREAAEAAAAASFVSTDAEDDEPAAKTARTAIKGSADGGKSGQRGSKNPEVATKKVDKGTLCHSWEDVNFSYTPYFTDMKVYTKADLAALVWQNEPQDDKKTRTPAEIYNRWTYATNQAEHIFTVLRLKGGAWSKVVVDGVLQMDLDALLSWHSSHTSTERRWNIMQLLHPGVYESIQAATVPTAKLTWDAVGKYVTAINKVQALHDDWKKKSGAETQRSDEDKAKLTKAFANVMKPKKAKKAD